MEGDNLLLMPLLGRLIFIFFVVGFRGPRKTEKKDVVDVSIEGTHALAVDRHLLRLIYCIQRAIFSLSGYEGKVRKMEVSVN